MIPTFTGKQWALSQALLATMLVLSAMAFFEVSQPQLKMTALDIGQGDSILIETPEHRRILVDTGIDSTVVDKLGEELGYFAKRIDLFIMTHPDRDHYAGVMDVLQKYEIGAVMMTGIANGDPLYQDFLAQIRAREIPIIYPRANVDYQVGKEVYLDFVYPGPGQSLIGKKVRDKNDTSITFRLIYQGKTLAMLSGDAEIGQELEMVLSGQDLSAEIFKLGHHGAKNASSPPFLNAINPHKVFVSAGKDNSYGHPHAEVLARVKDLEVRSTIEEGSITYMW